MCNVEKFHKRVALRTFLLSQVVAKEPLKQRVRTFWGRLSWWCCPRLLVVTVKWALPEQYFGSRPRSPGYRKMQTAIAQDIQKMQTAMGCLEVAGHSLEVPGHA